MIELVIFHLHIWGVIYVFVKRWQEDGIKEGLLASSIVILVFSVGWPLTRIISQLCIGAWEAFSGVNIDAVSLVFLLIPEIWIFRVLFSPASAPPQRLP